MTLDIEPSEERDSLETVEPIPEPLAPPPPTLSSMFSVELAARSHPGSDGAHNEDHYLVLRAERVLENLLTNLPESLLPGKFDEVAYGMIIADGLGGMPAGEAASAMALCKLVELVVETPDWVLRMNRRKAAVVKRRMSERFRRIDEALRQQAEKDSRLLGMSTTLTAACSLGTDLFLGHIGDSRAYLLRGNGLHQLTRDYTLGQALIDSGVGEAENTIVRGMRRVLTAALGMAELHAEPQIQHLRLKPRDQLLLCTDGLTEHVEAATTASILCSANSADEACRELIRAARNVTGEDNVTVVLARYGFPQVA
ncbi:MAG TPA: PP2C family serine/threonine-protein phosphatase [Blastocatellia bacterium]|nr:PP2C family serine/threonine-protein phosphatase [Blastocatellia bacterium]